MASLSYRRAPFALLAVAVIFRSPTAKAEHRRTFFDPSEFVVIGPSDPSTIISGISVALPIPNAASVDAELAARATPGSPSYGAWLSRAEVRARVDPGSAARAAARAALGGDVACNDLPTGLSCSASAATFNNVFGTALHAYTQLDENGRSTGIVHRVPPTMPFSIPAGSPITFVTALHDFPTRRRRPNAHARPVDSPSAGGRRLATDYYMTPGAGD